MWNRETANTSELDEWTVRPIVSGVTMLPYPQKGEKIFIFISGKNPFHKHVAYNFMLLIESSGFVIDFVMKFNY